MKIHLGITSKLTFIFVLFAALVLAGVGVLAYRSGQAALRTAVTAELLSMAIEKQTALDTWVDERKNDVDALARSPDVIREIGVLVSAQSGPAEAQAAHADLLEHFKVLTGTGNAYQELLVMDPDNAQVVISTETLEEGTFKENLPYFINGKIGPFVQNLYFSPALNTQAMTVSAPVRSADGRLLGVLAGRLPLEEMSALISRRTGLHQTDEAFLVDASSLFATQPRLMSDPAVMRRGVHTAAVDSCLEHASGVILADDYRGVPALVTYRWLPERQVCLIVKMDQAEAFGPSQEFGQTILLVGILTLLAAAVLAYGVANPITRPVRLLVEGTEKIRQGKLDTRIQIPNRDELGILGTEFNQMAAAISEKEAQLRAWAAELENRVEERTVELSASEERFRKAVESAPFPIMLHAEDGQVLTINQAWTSLTGYTQTDIPTTDLWTLKAYGNEMQPVKEVIERLYGGEGPSNEGEYTITTASGETITWDFSSAPLGRLPDGRRLVISMAMDVTRRKQDQAARKLSEEYYRAVIEQAGDGIFISDNSGKYIAVNQRGCDMLGYSLDELLSKNLKDLIPPDDKSSQPARIDDLRAGKVIISERRLICKDGSDLPVEISGKMLSNGNLQGIVRDITERKKSEEALQRQSEELKRSNAELERFAYVASHDLQEPLRMVTSYVQLLERRYNDKLDGDAREFIAYAVDGSNRMKALITDLLAYSRVGTRGREFRPTNCEAVLQDVLANLKIAIEESQAEISHDPLPQVMGDEVQLEQVFQNLIGNALKFHGAAAPRIHIGLARKENQWIFSVQDNGIGIDPQYFERIFIIFQRLHTRSKYEGTGIGLAVTKRIVERHGGRIWVESQPGGGSTFFFSIPGTGERQA